MLGWLKPAEVEVRTPGVWLTPRIFAPMAIILIGTCVPQSAWGRLKPEVRAVAGHGASARSPTSAAARPAPSRRRRLPRPLATLRESTAELLRARDDAHRRASCSPTASRR